VRPRRFVGTPREGDALGKIDIDSLLSDLGIFAGEDEEAREGEEEQAVSNSPSPCPSSSTGAESAGAHQSGGARGDSTGDERAQRRDGARPYDQQNLAALHDDGASASAFTSNAAPSRAGDEANRAPNETMDAMNTVSSSNDVSDGPGASPHSAGADVDADVATAAVERDSQAGDDLAAARDEANPVDLTDALTPLWSPEDGGGPIEQADTRQKADLGEVLLARSIVTSSQLDMARALVKRTHGKTLAAIFIEMGIEEEAIQEVVAEISGLPFERVNAEDGFHVKMLETLGLEFCRASQVMPLRKEGRWIVLGMVVPDDVFLLDEIRRRLGGAPIKPVLVTAADIALICELQSEEDIDDPGMDEMLAEVAEDDVEVVDEDEDDVDFEKQAGESPVIRYVNYIIQSALKEGASDIHIEPGETKVKVRFRIDGILFERMNPLAKMHAALISRLKIMASLDISERRMPQDGRIRAVVAGRKLDLRISTLPTVAGEKCVIRILDSRSISVGLDQLGFSEDTLTIWRNQIKQPHGIILVTGPTGSGKTTTLYSSLREMDTARMNVSTVEDPVEYHLGNVTQVQIHEKIGFTFASSLRSLLRQDPDVVMVGEIRDSETAKIAVQAALTGHLVLSTLHTNDAPSSVTRLINIGVEPFLIGSALNAVLAQRLVRRICSNCKQPLEVDEETEEYLAMIGQDRASVMHGTGCEKCRQTGYSGRLGIYELLVLDDVTRDYVARNPNVTEFRRTCIERGMVSLRQDGMIKVGHGMTTIEEVLRVTESTI